MISKTSHLLTLLALSVNYVLSAATQAQCVSLCSKLQKYSSYSATVYNGIGVVYDNCICKNPEAANMPLICTNFGFQSPTASYLFHVDKTGNWRCRIDSICNTLERAIRQGTFKPYDYYNVGKLGDKCKVRIYKTSSVDAIYLCQKFSTAYTGPSLLHYAPKVTGLWQCQFNGNSPK